MKTAANFGVWASSKIQSSAIRTDLGINSHSSLKGDKIGKYYMALYSR